MGSAAELVKRYFFAPVPPGSHFRDLGSKIQ